MHNYNKVVDSGERQEFDTGAVRDTQKGKGRFDLIPSGGLTRLAQHFENGAVKYSENNWQKGIPTKRYMDSAIRHLYKYKDGSRDEDHLAAAMWNIICMVQTEIWTNNGKLPPELDSYNADIKGCPPKEVK